MSQKNPNFDLTCWRRSLGKTDFRALVDGDGI
jgi:hypothetical protein